MDVVTQQVVVDVALDIPPPAQPALYDWIPARTAMLKLSDGGLFLAWVVQDGKGIDGLRLDPEWHVVAGPTALVVDAPTALHAPKLAELSNARVGMVWSGNSGLEIRYAEFASSLDAVTPSAGVVVNFETKGSQEYPDITPITGGDRVLISWGLENAPGPVHGRIVGSIEPLDLVPVHADLDLGGDCVTQGLPPVISTSAGGVLVAWFDAWNTQEVLITRPLGPL